MRPLGPNTKSSRRASTSIITTLLKRGWGRRDELGELPVNEASISRNLADYSQHCRRQVLVRQAMLGAHLSAAPQGDLTACSWMKEKT